VNVIFDKKLFKPELSISGNQVEHTEHAPT